MDDKISTKLIEEFDVVIPLYREFGTKLYSLIEELLADAGISVHSVTFRAKDKASFIKKLGKAGSSYTCVSDITDICGLRVITHFDDDVARVSRIIESEFDIDRENSANKSDILDPDRFGYLSVHYILSNNVARSGLREYRRFDGLKVEIQIRSILQHAWAEIEHDLGYKSPRGIPREVRRRFARLAGLLELADQEFSTIRDELGSYSSEVIDRIKEEPSLVELNAPSLQAFIRSSNSIKSLDTSIVPSLWILEDPSIEHCTTEVERLNYFNIRTIGALEESLKKHHGVIGQFAHAWISSPSPDDDDSDDPIRVVRRGISIFYLCYVLSVLQSGYQGASEYLERFRIGFDQARTAEKLVSILEGIRADKP